MDFNFIFCTDGILRMQYSGQPIAIPVTFVQEQENISDDYKFWFNWWNKNVVFEKGLTLGKFLECLSPWEVFWSNYCGINIDAYLKEGRKLSLVSEPAPFDWILCRRYRSIGPMFKHDDLSLADILSDSYHPQMRTEWNVTEHTTLSGYKLDEEDHFNVAGYSLNVVYNIPLYLNHTDIVEMLGLLSHNDTHIDKPSIFNPNGYGVQNTEGILYFESPRAFSLKDLLGSIFYDFETTPAERDSTNDELKRQLSEAMLEVEGDILENGLPDDKTMVIPSASLHGIKIEMQAELNYWNNITSLAKKSCTQPLKIGKIESGKEPVNYIYGYKIKNGDTNE